MPEVTLNYWAILVSGAAAWVLGAVWYSQPVFGKLWMKYTGMTMEGAKKSNMATTYIVGLVTFLVMAYVLAHYVDYTLATTFQDGLQAGFWAWLGFVGPVTIGGVLWEGKKLNLWVLNNAYHLLALLVMGVILTMWA